MSSNIIMQGKISSDLTFEKFYLDKEVVREHGVQWICNLWCRVLQCVRVCCSVLQSAAVCCSVLQCAAACCASMGSNGSSICGVVCCSVCECVAVCCSILQCSAGRPMDLQTLRQCVAGC